VGGRTTKLYACCLMLVIEDQSIYTVFILGFIGEWEAIGSEDLRDHSISGYQISRNLCKDSLLRSKNRSISVIDFVPHDDVWQVWLVSWLLIADCIACVRMGSCCNKRVNGSSFVSSPRRSPPTIKQLGAEDVHAVPRQMPIPCLLIYPRGQSWIAGRN
jgi:hypothetical protein